MNNTTRDEIQNNIIKNNQGHYTLSNLTITEGGQNKIIALDLSHLPNGSVFRLENIRTPNMSLPTFYIYARDNQLGKIIIDRLGDSAAQVNVRVVVDYCDGIDISNIEAHNISLYGRKGRGYAYIKRVISDKMEMFHPTEHRVEIIYSDILSLSLADYINYMLVRESSICKFNLKKHCTIDTLKINGGSNVGLLEFNTQRKDIDWKCGINNLQISSCCTCGVFTEQPTFKYGWKQLQDDIIAQLAFPEGTSFAQANGERKLRASQAEVVALYTIGGRRLDSDVIGTSMNDARFKYRVGKVVKPTDEFNSDKRESCGSGIHFFWTQQEAIVYGG